jgi:hypothetical protein
MKRRYVRAVNFAPLVRPLRFRRRVRKVSFLEVKNDRGFADGLHRRHRCPPNQGGVEKKKKSVILEVRKMGRWIVVYAVTQNDKYDLGSTAEFDDHKKAVECAKAMEAKGYHWAGVLEKHGFKRFLEKEKG